MKLYIPERFKDFPAIKGLDITIYQSDESFEDADIIVGNPKVVFDNPAAYPKLKFIQLLSAGYDSVPLDLLASNGIRVSNARGFYSIPIAEYCVTHLLAYYKNSHAYYASQGKGEWNLDLASLSLEGKRCLILGSGSIGFETAKRLRGFDVVVDGANSNGRSVDGFDRCIALGEVESVLDDYDIVISALPSNDATYHRVNASFLKAMKHNAVFINVGRGDVLDEVALELEIDRLGCVILDVFEKEPLPESSFLWQHPKVLLTPHISYSGDLNKIKSLQFLHANIQKYVNGDAVDNLITAL